MGIQVVYVLCIYFQCISSPTFTNSTPRDLSWVLCFTKFLSIPVRRCQANSQVQRGPRNGQCMEHLELITNLPSLFKSCRNFGPYVHFLNIRLNPYRYQGSVKAKNNMFPLGQASCTVMDHSCMFEVWKFPTSPLLLWYQHVPTMKPPALSRFNLLR